MSENTPTTPATPATPPTPTAADTNLGFELKKRRKWPWIVGGIVVVVGVVAAITIPLLNPSASANDQAGATLYVATAEGNASEEALVNYVAANVAPKYGIKVEFKGLADSNTINRAVSDGEVAATVYQHKLWLGQVLQANPDFKEEAATPVFRWGFGLWSDKYTDPSQIPDTAKSVTTGLPESVRTRKSTSSGAWPDRSLGSISWVTTMKSSAARCCTRPTTT